MALWRNIPAQFKWDGESMTPASTRTCPVRVKPSKVTPVLLAPESPETPPNALPLDKLDGLSEEEKIAALKTEAALDAVLALVPNHVITAPEPESQPEQEPAENAAQECPVPGQNSLWESPVQDLPTGNSAIYPNGRPISNPNHLMLFVRRGAEVIRSYMQTGWISQLRRPDGRLNPLPEALVETLINSGVLTEGRPGVFRGD